MHVCACCVYKSTGVSWRCKHEPCRHACVCSCMRAGIHLEVAVRACVHTYDYISVCVCACALACVCVHERRHVLEVQTCRVHTQCQGCSCKRCLQMCSQTFFSICLCLCSTRRSKSVKGGLRFFFPLFKASKAHPEAPSLAGRVPPARAARTACC